MSKSSLAAIERKLDRALAQLKPAKASLTLAFSRPEAQKGEVYAGCYSNAAGRITHFFLHPEEKSDIQWNASLDWARKLGKDCDLPNRIEQAILHAQHGKLFQKRTYWSNEQYAGSGAYAWGQSFLYGGQDGWRKGSKSMARAVRRVTI